MGDMSDHAKLIGAAEELIQTSEEFVAVVASRGGPIDAKVHESLLRTQKCIDESRELLERLRSMTPPPEQTRS